MDNDERYLSTAIRAAKVAGQVALYYRSVDLKIDAKANHADLVTEADREAERRVREIIGSDFPGHTVLGEEEGSRGDDVDHRWLVDPLDGTLNYASRFPVYCCSIALEVEGALRVGVIYDPERDELFTAIAGRGADLNGAPLRVTQTTTLRDGFLATGFSFRGDAEEVRETMRVAGEILLRARGLRRPGAAAIDLAYVAAGRYDGFWETGLKPWDVAAGSLIIREAGGRVSDEAGAPHRYDHPTIVASNGRLHDELLTALREA